MISARSAFCFYAPGHAGVVVGAACTGVEAEAGTGVGSPLGKAC